MAPVTGIIDLTGIIEKTTVPNNNKARLMYYLNCIGSLLELDDSRQINRFVKFCLCVWPVIMPHSE